MNEIDPALVRRVMDRFSEAFPGEAPRVAAAPGRVNLIGEHTDYNDGFVLPMAIARHALVAFRPRSDGVLCAHSIAYGETKQAAVSSLAPPGGHDWFSYLAGVVWAFAPEGLPVCGMDVVVDGNVPIGAGLSSSAALEMAMARALAAAGGAAWDARRMAKLGQRAENRYVGMNCGIMDQFASAACEEGSALLLDCRSLETRAEPVPAGVYQFYLIAPFGDRPEAKKGTSASKVCDESPVSSGCGRLIRPVLPGSGWLLWPPRPPCLQT